SPRTLSALIRFEPMKPAAPVTMIYKRSPLKLYVDAADLGGHERHAGSHSAKKFIADGARRGGDVIDRKPFAPKYRRTADSSLGHVRQIDGHQVHRHAARSAHFPAANEHRRTVRRVARITVTIAAGDHPYAICARGGVPSAVADAVVGLQVLDGNQLAAQGHHGLQAQHVRRVVRKWR